MGHRAVGKGVMRKRSVPTYRRWPSSLAGACYRGIVFLTLTSNCLWHCKSIPWTVKVTHTDFVGLHQCGIPQPAQCCTHAKERSMISEADLKKMLSVKPKLVLSIFFRLIDKYSTWQADALAGSCFCLPKTTKSFREFVDSLMAFSHLNYM